MKGPEWIAAVPRPQPAASVRVERHPALASADPAERYKALQEPAEAHALGQTFRLDQLPYLLAFADGQAVGAASLALFGDDLVLLGLAGQPDLGRPDLCAELVREAAEVGREIGRRRILAPLTNADPLALFFLQSEGFTLSEVNPYVGPERTGLGGIVATHELVLEHMIA